MYNDFIKRLRICAKIAVEVDPWYSEINSDSRRDSPGLFSPAQANALRNTGDIDIYLTYYATGPPKSSLTRVTSALLLDPFFDGYVDKVLAGQNWYLLPSIFTLPWVLVIPIFPPRSTITYAILRYKLKLPCSHEFEKKLSVSRLRNRDCQTQNQPFCY